ncbi:sperm-associated antigen 17 [Nematolebias whitei]|uniref:sperm-associated antigen 17 n=1 Tax=Nematolebias whitei TaxID=451745 RepID=UPI00189AEFF9|nr:sperm-associated antigen 17 [Nematolebias whitei]
MPPAGKKGSDKKPAGPAASVNKNWEAGLVKAQFEEDSWQACVSLLVGRSPEEEERLLGPLVLAVQKPQRRRFTVLSWDSALTKIHELGNPKAKKPNNPPMFCEVTESAKVLLDAGEEIPSDLMAKLLKFQLLQIKTSDQQRREAEQTERQAEKVVRPSDSSAKGSAKKAKGSSSDPEAKEKKTKLKSRNHVEPPTFIDDEPEHGPQHYILLVGFFQPQLVWMLNAIGVHVANVIKLCSEQTQVFVEKQELSGCEDDGPSPKTSPGLGAELSLKAKRLDQFWTNLRPVLYNGPPDSKLYDAVLLSYTVQDLTLSLQTQDPEAKLELGSQIFEGVANLIYDCLDWRRQHQHYCDNVKLLTVPSVDGLDSQPVQVVPAVPLTPRSKKKSVQEQVPPEQGTQLSPVSVHVDMGHYNSLLDLVPPEACSVPLLLHCMLEQVGISAEQSLSGLSRTPEKPKPVCGQWFKPQLLGYLLQSFLPLSHTDEERKQLLDNLPTVEEDDKTVHRLATFGGASAQKKPLLLRHHDERALRLRDATALDGFSPAEVELSMMRFSPVWELIESMAERRNRPSCWKAVKQQLQHFCTEETVSWSDVERLFDQSVFEAMTLSALDEQGVFVNDADHQGPLEAARCTLNVVPWDDPLSYAEHQLHKAKGPAFLTEDPGSTERFIQEVSTQLDLSELQRCRRRSLFGWHYTERHSAAVFPQVLMAASEEYRCLDTFRGSHKNILYVFCHNPVSSQLRSKEFWDVALHTDVKFRHYLEHVADSISDWTKEEELKREATLLRTQSPVAASPHEAVEERTLEPIIRKGSIKAWKLEQERAKEEEMTKRSKKENTPRAKLQKEEAADEKKSKTLSDGKKSRAETATSKVPAGAKIPAAPTERSSEGPRFAEEPEKRFTGYSMNGRLIRVSGRVQNLYPSDGGHITVENIDFVEGSSLMKVAVIKDGHRFYAHINQVVGDCSEPHSKTHIHPKEDCRKPEAVVGKRVKQGNFSAVLDNKVHLSYSFYGPTGERKVSSEETEEDNPKCSSTAGSKETNLEPDSSRRQTQSSQGCEDQSGPFSSLCLSVPNGLLVHFLREDMEGVSQQERGVLVKQSFPLHAKGRRLLQDASLSKELYRIITSQGAVIRHMRDGSTEVLFPDGSVSFSQDSGPVWVPDAEIDNTNKGQTSEPQKGCWQTTSPSGHRICTVGSTHKHLPTTSLLTFKATDPVTHQVMLTREDLVVLVQNPDGSLIVEHADGTRITSFLQDRTFTGSPHHPLLTGQKPESAGSSSQFTLGESAGSERSVHRHDEQTAFPDGAKTNERGGPSVSERAVLVEKEGCASVLMYPERHTARVFLADGTVITGNNRAEYEVFPPNAGVLHIRSNGKCTYSSDPLVAPNSSNQPGVYTISHAGEVACDVTDDDGNHFQVMEDGQIFVLRSSPAASTRTHDEEEGEDRKRDGIHIKDKAHPPRLFLVHEDGSGTELLSSPSVEELLDRAHSDPTIAVLKEPLPDKQDEFGITILKPSHRSAWFQWLLKKQKPDITPPNLRNRSWDDFPTAEKKSPGRPFGTDMGVGLTLRERSSGSAAQHQRVQSCPDALEMRELYQHRPFTTPLKNTIDSHLKEYIESLMASKRRSDEMKVKDPRTKQESTHAGDLFDLILSFAEEDDDRHSADTKLSADVASLYSQAVGASYEQSEVSDDTDMDADSLDGSQHSSDRKSLKWSERLTQHRLELSEEKTCRESLRKKIVVPYFHPENFTLFQSLLHSQISNVGSRPTDLPQSDSPDSVIEAPLQESNPPPLNPTPSESERRAERDKMPEKRPTNPTMQFDGQSSRSVQVDVTGSPTQTKVRPTCVLNSKTYSEPDQRFLTVEEPVKRKCRTVSLTGSVVRGFQLHPSSVDFGTLQEGTSSTITVILKNVGVDMCRFRVKQPPAATGLRVLYNPGPVAAGLHVELKVQLFATCAAQLGGAKQNRFIFQNIVNIHTETDILHLPVTAVILSERFYEEEYSSVHKKRSSNAVRAHSWSENHSDEPAPF